jgi:hypothetical protein
VVNKVRSKNYENGHKNIFGLLVALELKVENSTILTFKVIFLCQKIDRILFNFFFIEEYKKGEQLLLMSYFDNFNF